MHAAWYMTQWFMAGGGSAILAAAAVNAHKLLWGVKHMLLAKAPLRGLTEAVPVWSMSQSMAVNVALTQGFLIFMSATVLSVGTISAMSGMSGETPATLIEWQEKYNAECRVVLEQAP